MRCSLGEGAELKKCTFFKWGMEVLWNLVNLVYD